MFKVGDKVRRLVSDNTKNGSTKRVKKGEVYEVTAVNNTWLELKGFEDWGIVHNAEKFELVETKETNKMEENKIYYNRSSYKYYKLLAIISGQGYLLQRYSHLTNKLYEGQGKKMFIPVEEFVQERWKEYTPKQSGTTWVNVYNSNGATWSSGHNSKELADSYSGLDRLACVEVKWTEGQGLNK